MDNISSGERAALKALRTRNDIVIKKADKNNICVIMNKSDYIREGERQLNTQYYILYSQINEPDLTKLKCTIEHKISDMKAKGNIDKITYSFLCDTKQPRVGRLYFLPKIHKLDINTFNKIKKKGCANKT